MHVARLANSIESYSFPQALIKQIPNFDSRTLSNVVDFYITINPAKSFNLVPNQPTIPKEKSDLEYCVAHEILHGMGFTSTLQNYKVSILRTVSYLAPLVLRDPINNEYYVNPISIYDSFLYHGKESFAEIGRAFNTIGKQGITNLKEYGDYLESNPDFMASALQLYDLATSEYLNVILPTGEDIMLKIKNKNDLNPASSISHFSDEYRQSADFLMTAAHNYGTTLNSEMLKWNSNSVMGPNTMALLEAMGWATRRNPNPVQLILNN